MKIGILTYSSVNAKQSGGDYLIASGTKRGHTVELLYQSFFSFIQSEPGGSVEVLYDSKPFSRDFDIIISRPNFVEEPSIHSITTQLLVQSGFRVMNHRPALSLTKNKLSQKALMAEAGIPIPRWAIIRHPDNIESAVEKLGFPIIAKVAFGTGGKGVFFAENLETLKPIADYLAIRDRNPVILEEFIAEAEHKDLRVFVVGDQVAAAMQRAAKDGDVRANLHSGGKGTPIEVTKDEGEIAIRTAKLFELDCAGVDILRSKRGPLVIEVNSNPGLEGITEATGIDVAGAIIELAEQMVKQG